MNYFCIVIETQYKGGLSRDNSIVLEGVASRRWFGMIPEAPGLSATHQQSVNGSNAKLIARKTCVWGKIKEKEQVSNMHNGPSALKSEVMWSFISVKDQGVKHVRTHIKMCSGKPWRKEEETININIRHPIIIIICLQVKTSKCW